MDGNGLRRSLLYYPTNRKFSSRLTWINSPKVSTWNIGRRASYASALCPALYAQLCLVSDAVHSSRLLPRLSWNLPLVWLEPSPGPLAIYRTLSSRAPSISSTTSAVASECGSSQDLWKTPAIDRWKSTKNNNFTMLFFLNSQPSFGNVLFN